MSASLMVIHDKGDRFVPYSEGAELAAAWPEGRLMTTFGLGHHRILRDRDVVNAAVDFVADAFHPRTRDEQAQCTPMI